MISIAVRAALWAALFVSLVLVLVPAWAVRAAGGLVTQPSGWAIPVGLLLLLVGGGIALSSVIAFVVVGRGTPAPFDPPRKLVIAGPYKYVRNPMYVGAILALLGVAVYYRSLAIAAVAAVYAIGAHLFVIFYEEPTLGRKFGDEYRAYRMAVPRWIARRGGFTASKPNEPLPPPPWLS